MNDEENYRSLWLLCVEDLAPDDMIQVGQDWLLVTGVQEIREGRFSIALRRASGARAADLTRNGDEMFTTARFAA